MNGEKVSLTQAYPLLAQGPPELGVGGGRGGEERQSVLGTFGGAEMIGQ